MSPNAPRISGGSPWRNGLHRYKQRRNLPGERSPAEEFILNLAASIPQYVMALELDDFYHYKMAVGARKPDLSQLDNDSDWTR